MHDSWADMPGLTGLDWLPGLTTFQHGKIAVEQIGSVEARMGVKSCIHVGREFDQHYHSFVVAVRNVERFEGGSPDRLRHDGPPDLQCGLVKAEFSRNTDRDEGIL